MGTELGSMPWVEARLVNMARMAARGRCWCILIVCCFFRAVGSIQLKAPEVMAGSERTYDSCITVS